MKMCPVEAIYVVNFSGKDLDNGYETDEIDGTKKMIFFICKCVNALFLLILCKFNIAQMPGML